MPVTIMKFVLMIYLILIITFACSPSENESSLSDKIIFLKSISINVPEPSGLAFDEGFLWTLSDENSTVYKLDTIGNIITSFVVEGDDLEGITVLTDSSLAIVLERTREVKVISKSGRTLNQFTVNVSGELNYGLEGITIDPTNNHIYILNEKLPSLVIEFDGDNKEVSRKELNFADDISGICYDTTRNGFWIISDESQTISLCNYNFEVLESFKVNIPQMEGVAFDPNTNRLYVVSDRTESLYIYQLIK